MFCFFPTTHTAAPASQAGAETPSPARAIGSLVIRPLVRAVIWAVGYGAVYASVRDLLPSIVRDLVFAVLAADLAGFMPIKSFRSWRENLYASVEARVLGGDLSTAAPGSDSTTGGSNQGSGPESFFGAGANGGPKMQFFSFGTTGGGASFQSGNINLNELFNQMNEEISRHQRENGGDARSRIAYDKDD